MVEVDLTDVAADAVLASVASAAVRAVGAHRTVAGRLDGSDSVVRSPRVHLGVLSGDGSTSAVVEDADELMPAALASRIADNHRAGADFTLGIVHTGALGSLLDTPALGEGRATVLGVGAVVRRPVVMPIDGGEVIAVRAMAHLSLSYDPRLLTGSDAARFLHAIRLDLEEGAA